MELEAVALVLKGRSTQPMESRGRESEFETVRESLEKHSKAVKGLSTGVSLLIVSILIGVAMAFFVPPQIPWILAWAVLVGWMAMWGGIEVGNGIAGLLEAKSRLRLLGLPGLPGKQSANDVRTDRISAAGEPPLVTDRAGASRPSLPSSVTEGTTRHLDDSVKK